MDEPEVMLAAVLLVAAYGAAVERRRRLRNRRWWVRPWLSRREDNRGSLSLLHTELRVEDADSFQNYVRMSGETFEKLLSYVRDDITHQDTNMRQAIPPRQRLAVTLRFLATGETFKSLSYSTRMAHNTISKIVSEVLEAIIRNLQATYLKAPCTTQEWEEIAKTFHDQWNFPNCLGAMDGKHITFRPPRSSGSFYRNYKGSDSIVLLAIVDANYKFLCIDIGQNGRISDGGIFRRSAIHEAVMDFGRNILNFPGDKPLPGTAEPVPYVFVADDAFPLSSRVMKPYRFQGLNPEKKIYNYRLSRARRVVENAFGILSNRFRVLLTPMNLAVQKVERVATASILLHNFLIAEKEVFRVDTDNQNIEELLPLNHQGGNRTGGRERYIQNMFCQYFNGNGLVDCENNV